MLGDLRRKIASLTDWIKAIKNELSKPQAPDLADLLGSVHISVSTISAK